MMGGEIGVDSRPGAGSTFAFTARFGLQSGHEPTSALSGRMPGLRILVVDDNAAAREIFLAMLASLDFDADAVAGGAEALVLLEQAQRGGSPYGLVLLDWRMPRMDGIETLRRIRAHPALLDTPLCMMVTAYDREALQRRVDDEQLRLDGLLVKPVSPSSLCDGLMSAFGLDTGRRLSRIGCRPAQGEAEQRRAAEALAGARLLLVEDNPTNRELALEILGQAGVCVDVAGDGEEALQKVASGRYDGVLMDCQMPVMDGYEATRRLRADPAHAGLPVIAMTANVMAGDRERCLASGMNDHISKPIDLVQLFTTLARWVKPAAPAPVVGRARPAPPPPAPIAGLDLEGALARLGGDTVLLRRLLRGFCDGQRQSAAGIRAAWQAGERDGAVRRAHTLKGLAGNIGAGELAAAAARLEQALRAEAAELPAAALAAVATLVDDLIPRIDAALAAQTPAPASPPPADPAALTAGLRELARLLAADEAAATAAVEPLAPFFQEGPNAQTFRRLAKLVAGYDFDAALGPLNELATRIGVHLD